MKTCISIQRQQCTDLYLHVRYVDKELYWNEMNESEQLGPFYYGTDYGSCCYFSGQANLEKWPEGTNSVKVRKCDSGGLSN